MATKSYLPISRFEVIYMKVTFSLKGIFFEDDFIECEVDVIDKEDFAYEKQRLADMWCVDYDSIQDDLEPEEKLDLFGVTLFADREE